MADIYESELERLRDLARTRGDAEPLSPELFEKLRQLDLYPDTVAESPLPEQIGSYRIIAERGRGGMGVVYEATDATLGRRVAVKVLATGRYSDAKARERFQREARAAASLQHENLVTVFASEIPNDGPPYLVMPFIDGPTLADLIATRRVLEPRFAADMIRQVAGGVQALHAARFIHRDIKPGNILLAKSESAFVPKLTDFGLAREEQHAAVTTAGTIAGTPSYLSPEQIHSPGSVDARADVYALGATLYECLTGVPPFRGATLDVLLMIGENDPVPPRTLNRDVPRDLETICMKCLAKRPEKRYATAIELRSDLARFLANESIIARPAGPIERSTRWVQRNPWAASVIVVSLLGAVSAGLGWWRAVEKTALAEEFARKEADARLEADVAAAAATTARHQADEQAMLALGTINTLVGKAQNLADRTPGTLGLKKQLAEIALADLKKLAANFDRIAGVDVTTVRAHAKLGETYQLLGNLTEARSELNRGVAILTRMPPERAKSLEVLEQTGLIHHSLAVIERFEGRLDASQVEAEASVKALRAARLLDPTSFSLARQLSVAINCRGEVHFSRGTLRQALDEYREGLAVCESLLPDHTGNSQLHRDLAFTESRIAMMFGLRFEFAAAEPHSASATRYAEQSLALDPTNAERQRATRIAITDRAMHLFNMGEYAKAYHLIEPLVPVAEASAKEARESLAAQRDLAVVQSLLGCSLMGLNRLDEAAEWLERSFTLRESLGSAAVTDLGQIGQLLISVNARRNRYDLAAHVCERVVQACDRLEKTAGIDTQLQSYRKLNVTLRRTYEHVPGVLAAPETLADLPMDFQHFVGCVCAVHHVRSGDLTAAEALFTKLHTDPDEFKQRALTGMFIYTIAAARSTETAVRDQHLSLAHKHAEVFLTSNPMLRFSLLNYPELLPLRAYPPFQSLIASLN